MTYYTIELKIFLKTVQSMGKYFLYDNYRVKHKSKCGKNWKFEGGKVHKGW